MAHVLRGPEIEIEFASPAFKSKVILNGENISQWCRSVKASADVDDASLVTLEIYPEKLKLVITDPEILKALEVKSERPNPFTGNIPVELDKAKRAAEIVDVPTLVTARAVGDYHKRIRESLEEKTDGNV